MKREFDLCREMSTKIQAKDERIYDVCHLIWPIFDICCI